MKAVEKEKDNFSFDRFIISIQKELYLIAKARLNNEDDIADAIQETILNSYNNYSKIKEEKYLKTYVIRVLINECNKIYKKKKKIGISFEEKEFEKYIRADEKER